MSLPVLPPESLIRSLLRNDAGTPGSPDRRFPSLTPGQVVTARVIGGGNAGTATISLKGRSLEMQSPLPLRPGDTLTLRVQETHPRLLFQVLDGGRERPMPTGGYIGRFLATPGVLSAAFAKAASIVRGEGMNVLVRVLGRQDADALASFIRSLVFTREHRDGGFRTRDYLDRLGLFMERNLSRASGRTWGQGQAARAATGNLKALLLSAEERLSAPGERVPASLLRAVGSVARALETWQVVNALLGEQDRSLFFQVPLSLGDRLAFADIVLTGDDESGNDEGEERRGSLRLSVDMDSLGPLAVQAALSATGIACTITCEHPETARFLDSFTEELERALEAAGCPGAQVVCRSGPVRSPIEDLVPVLEAASGAESLDVKA